MPLLVIIKFDKDQIKNGRDYTQDNICPIISSLGKIFQPSRASNSEVNSLIWPKFEILRFYSCPCYLQVWGISNQNWSHYLSDNIFTIIHVSIWELIFSIQGQVVNSLIWLKFNSSENLWLSWLPASLMKIDQNWRHYRSDKVKYGLFRLNGK